MKCLYKCHIMYRVHIYIYVDFMALVRHNSSTYPEEDFYWSMTLIPGALFTKRSDVLPQYLTKSRSCEIRVWTFPLAPKFDWHHGNGTAEMPVKCQSDMIIITYNLAASTLREIWWEDVLLLSEYRPQFPHKSYQILHGLELHHPRGILLSRLNLLQEQKL